MKTQDFNNQVNTILRRTVKHAGDLSKEEFSDFLDMIRNGTEIGAISDGAKELLLSNDRFFEVVEIDGKFVVQTDMNTINRMQALLVIGQIIKTIDSI